jgi:hypothetical protein
MSESISQKISGDAVLSISSGGICWQAAAADSGICRAPMVGRECALLRPAEVVSRIVAMGRNESGGGSDGLELVELLLEEGNASKHEACR